MAVAFRAAASSSNAAGTSLTCTKPTGTADGDVMLAIVGARNTNLVTCTPTEAGWTEVLAEPRVTNGKLFIYRRVAASEGASYTFTLSLSSLHKVTILSFTGVDTTTPVDAVLGASAAAATAQPCPDITTTVANCEVVRVAHTVFGNSTPHTYSWAISELSDSETIDGSTGTIIGVASELQAAAGATGAETATASAFSAMSTYVVASLALRPAAGGAPAAGNPIRMVV